MARFLVLCTEVIIAIGNGSNQIVAGYHWIGYCPCCCIVATRCPGRVRAMVRDAPHTIGPTAQRAGGLRARMGDEGKAVGFPRLTALLSEPRTHFS